MGTHFPTKNSMTQRAIFCTGEKKTIGIEKSVYISLPKEERKCTEDEFYGQLSCLAHHR